MKTTEGCKLLCSAMSLLLLNAACGASKSDGAASGGSPSTAGSVGAAMGGDTSGGTANGAEAGQSSNGGSQTGSGGTQSGAAGANPSHAGSAGSITPTGDNCTVGAWPAADPTAVGPYATVTENEVGPEAGEAESSGGAGGGGADGGGGTGPGVVPKFTLFRPKDLSPGGLCHPVITWGNGTGSTPSAYRSLLTLFASHGFVVIASNSKNVARGTPRPMVVGIDWVLQQNEDPSSVLYHHLDATHIGATGHSQGAVATSQAAGDNRILTNVPIEGAQVQKNLHGPAMFFCGGMDDVVGCTGAQSALTAVTTLPAMYAEYLSVDHGSWLSFGNKPSVVYGAVTAWMRVHLMADTALRPWFYGASCKLCTDAGWQIQQKNMDQ